MRTIALFMILALVACKKEEPKLEETVIHAARTTFRVNSKYPFTLLINWQLRGHMYPSDTFMRTWRVNKFGDHIPVPDTSMNLTVKQQKIYIGRLTGQKDPYTTTITVTSDHKTYSFVDSLDFIEREITLW